MIHYSQFAASRASRAPLLGAIASLAAIAVCLGDPQTAIGTARAAGVPVADTYDVLVSDRPYRRAFNIERAVRILRAESGTHLWEPAVRALLRSLGERVDDQAAA